MKEDRELLSKYFPEQAVEAVYTSLKEKNVQLRISRSRSTKLGDYRPGMNGKPHRISINHDLNIFEFLITYVHELAHLYTFEKFGRRHQPHGKEWKQFFVQLMIPFLNNGVFPAEIQQELQVHLLDAKAANGSDLDLKRILQKYNHKQNLTATSVESLSENSYFKLPDGRVFQRLELRRKRYKCLCMNNKRLYLFSPLAMVEVCDRFEPNQFLHLLKKLG
ncbi:MAG: sprT domain-containing protein [Bacteroidetes bacterium HGW-Bacteroidetes-1]|jgi:hypothetical protein|nr:MAG: sprT domain-containing protein [Bacteroidetes bacterium HGW-Bacteroidetes-1]